MERSVIPRYSAAQQKSPQIVPKITIFLVFMNKTQILLFALHDVPSASAETTRISGHTLRVVFVFVVRNRLVALVELFRVS